MQHCTLVAHICFLTVGECCARLGYVLEVFGTLISRKNEIMCPTRPGPLHCSARRFYETPYVHSVVSMLLSPLAIVN
jgi:hypothetical protein